jgi:AMP nucleosidase
MDARNSQKALKMREPLILESVTVETNAEAVIARLVTLYDTAIGIIRDRFERFAAGALSQDDPRHGFYPAIRVEIPAEESPLTSSLALGRIASAHVFETTITHPQLFAPYLAEELTRIFSRFKAVVRVGVSNRPIPLSFGLEAATATLTPEQRQAIPIYFYTPNLAATDDAVVDGQMILDRSGPLPLSLFTAERIDYSLLRIRHYTATHPSHFQPFILFTNYQRYVDEFVDYARAEIDAGRAWALVEPGERISTREGSPPCPPLSRLPQMPAWHLVRKGKHGVTLVNIGVGPSNAKTITDHLGVLRPHVWLMIGHCGALRRTQRLGDYVLAHAYLRDDHVLDHALPPSIPLPTIAEVQRALTAAVEAQTGLSGPALKRHLRTGTVVTTDDRNWELRFRDLAVRLNQSRAIAIDMESATVAANGYRYRVPYGTLLCASDRPLHGELKLPGMADAFYQERIGQHLKIGLDAIERLQREAEAGTLHSRKLRSFDEPLLR